MRFSTWVAASVALVVSVSSAYGITAGPGGKIYFMSDGPDSTAATLAALRIGTDWTTTTGDYYSLGTVADVAKPNDYVRSPEILVSGGMDGWAALGLGINYSGDATKMQLLSVQTNATGNTVTVLGTGRSSGTGNTNTSIYGFPDVKGTFTGHAGAFVVSSGGTAYAVWDADSSGNAGDSDADYHAAGAAFSYPHYADIRGAYMFGYSNSYYDDPPGLNLGVTKNLGGGNYRTSFWYTKPSGDSGNPIGSGGISADCVNIKGIGLCTAVYAATTADATAGIARGITMFVDKDRDDCALSAGEQVNIVNLSGTLPVWWRSDERFYDIEVVKGGDGTRFLLLVGNTYDGPDRTLTALKLADNGEFSGNWVSDAKLICQSTDAWDGVVSSVPHFSSSVFANNFEFDATVAAVPEPATLLLLGSGALGAAGFLRRRRMK